MPMRTARLILPVTYDDATTDAEAVAEAVDKLIETALSTPGVLDEYGKPTMGSTTVLDDLPEVAAGAGLPRSAGLRFLLRRIEFLTNQHRLLWRVASDDPNQWLATVGDVRLQLTNYDQPHLSLELQGREFCTFFGESLLSMLWTAVNVQCDGSAPQLRTLSLALSEMAMRAPA